MFWTSNNSSSPQFEAMLQKEGTTLRELMDQEDVIQECKLQNKKLVEFLCKRNILEELVTLITEEPSEDLDERTRFKYPNIACELLTCDVPTLNESLSRDNELLEQLYSFIEKEPPLNPLLASFFSRTLGVLIVKRLDQHWISYQFTCLQAMGFLKDKDNFISLLLKHLGTSAIMDLTLKLITEVGDVEHRQNLLNWLDSKYLIQSLVALLDPKVDSERHFNASQLLCDVLRISRDTTSDHRERIESDPILTRLESPETVDLLLDQILGADKSETSIVGGIQVLLAQLGHRNNFNDNNMLSNTSDETEAERKKVADSTALVILRRLKEFQQILLDPPKRPAVKTSIGCLDPPLGNTRLQVVKLIAALISINNSDLLREMINLGMMEVLLDLFFKYVWNNFLHAQVERCIAAAFKAHCKQEDSDENAMYSYLINKCRLLGRILEAWDDNEQKQTKPKGVRQGYMGHLVNIANNVIQEYESNSSLNAFIKENVSKDTMQAWENFVIGPLNETNRIKQIVLGGVHPSNLPSDDSNDDYNMHASMYQQHRYNDYQIQQVAPEIFYYNDGDDQLQNTIERCANINLNINDSEMTQQAEIFKKVCSEYVNTFDDADDSIFEEQISGSNPAKQAGDESWDPRGNSSDEDDTEKKMEADPWFSVEGIKSKMAINETANPWSSADASNIDSSQDSGWADFGSFSTTPDFPIQTSSTEDAQTPNMDSGDKSSVLDVAPEKLCEEVLETCPDKKNKDEDKCEVEDNEDEEMFECASENVPTETIEASDTTLVDTSSQSCTNDNVSNTDSNTDSVSTTESV